MDSAKAKSNARRLLLSSKRYARRGLSHGWGFLKLCRRQLRRGPLLVRRGDVYYIPLWLPMALALILASTVIWGDIARVATRASRSAVAWVQGRQQGDLADFFAPSVRHWSGEIDDWAREYEVERDLLATVMQIESCGHPTVVSVAGAQGLFQVMPFHFTSDENMIDPATNARRGATYLNYCHQAADGVIGLALACYNGGPGVINQARDRWSHETQKYYRWGVGIYSDAVASADASETLDLWLRAGGERLCDSAAAELRRLYPDAPALDR